MNSSHGFVNPEIDPVNGQMIDHAGLDILSEKDCVTLMSGAPVGRIAFVDQGEPVILPINIGWWDQGVVFSTQRGSKLHAAVMGTRVAVEVDGFDEPSQSGWSVLARGVASVVTDGRTIGSLDRLAVRSWVRPEKPKHWVQVRIETISGRRTPAKQAEPGG